MPVEGKFHTSLKPELTKRRGVLGASVTVKLLPNLGTYMSRINSFLKGLW